MGAVCCCAAADDSPIRNYDQDDEVFSGGSPLVLPMHKEPPSYDVTQEEKRKEKLRLQGQINSFTKDAIQGCSCTFIDETTREHIPCEYVLDLELESLRIAGRGGETVAKLAVSGISNVFAYVGHGWAPFPDQALRSVGLQERELLINQQAELDSLAPKLRLEPTESEISHVSQLIEVGSVGSIRNERKKASDRRITLPTAAAEVGELGAVAALGKVYGAQAAETTTDPDLVAGRPARIVRE